MKEGFGKFLGILIFWILVFGFLGGIDLIKDVFSGVFVWLYIIIRRVIITMLIVTPIYFVWEYFFNSK